MSLKGTIQLRYIRSREEQLRILRACHSDATSGHLGFKKTLARVTERFTWYGMTKDVEYVVSVNSLYQVLHVHVCRCVIAIQWNLSILHGPCLLSSCYYELTAPLEY